MSPQNFCLNVVSAFSFGSSPRRGRKGRSCQPIPKVCRTEIETQQTWCWLSLRCPYCKGLICISFGYSSRLSQVSSRIFGRCFFLCSIKIIKTSNPKKTGVSTFSKTQEVDAKNTVSPSAAASDSCTMVHTNSAVPARSWVRSTGIWSRKHSLAGPAKHSKHGKHSKYGLYRLSICKQDSLLASHQRGKWEIHNAICSINTLCLTIVATANRRCCW